MTGTTITTTTYAAITLGRGGDNGPLSVTSNGALLAPNGYGQTAVAVAPATRHATIVNAGSVAGGAGYYNGFEGGAGGDGILAMTAVKIMNRGRILGGVGGLSPVYGGLGGAGVYFGAAGSRLVNHGAIFGGNGGDGYTLDHGNRGYDSGGVGGVGVLLAASGVLSNFGRIGGGSAGEGGAVGAVGGSGVVIIAAGASLANAGMIYGGYGGGDGGAAIAVTAAADVTNTGTIIGGTGGLARGAVATGGNGGAGASLTNGASLENTGVIIAGRGGFAINEVDGVPLASDDDQGGAGGIGLVANRAFVSNTGSILGGTGAESQFGGAGGDGAVTSYASIFNQGTIAAGAGADGFVPQPASGGQNGGAAGQGATGGIGVSMTGGSLQNAGRIFGGDGGGGGAGAKGGDGYQGAPDGGSGGAGGMGGDGGDGVDLAGGILLNTGVILGGDGGAGGEGGAGGARGSGQGAPGKYGLGGRGGYGSFGAYVNGGTLINAGTIAGGVGGANAPHAVGADNDQRALAVCLGAAKTTLVVATGAVFVGGILAENTADVLDLTGTSTSPLQNFEGFGTVEFAPGAAWTISANIGNLASGQTIAGFAPGDAIEISAAAGAGKVTVGKAGVVTIKAGGDIYRLDIDNAVKGAKNYKFANDTLVETPAKMAFAAPAASPPAPPPGFMLHGQTAAFVSNTSPPARRVATAITGGAHDMILAWHKDVQTMVTLHAG